VISPRRITLSIGLYIALVCLPAHAAQDFEISSPDQNTVRITYQLAEFSLQEVSAAGQTVTKVTLAHAQPRQELGAPELPTLTTSVSIASQGTPSLRIVSRQEREISLDLILPSLGHIDRNIDPSTVARVFGQVYSSGQVFPENVVELGRPFVLGDRRGVNLRVNPLRWDPARGVLLITEAITVEIVTAGHGGINPLPASAPTSSRAFRALHKQVFPDLASGDVQNKMDKYNVSAEQGRMLIISHDEFAPALTSFRHWKARRGIASELVLMSETDGTAAGLRQLIANKYLANTGLTWVVLVGDKAQVPTTDRKSVV